MEVVIIMGLFDKFKKKEDVQQIKTDEQRELENIVQQNHAIFDNAFLGKRATDKEILQAEQQLRVKISRICHGAFGDRLLRAQRSE